MAVGPIALMVSSRRLFPSRDAALRAAERAAAEQRVPGQTTGISDEDEDGRWHDEVSNGRDRPITEVKD